MNDAEMSGSSCGVAGSAGCITGTSAYGYDGPTSTIFVSPSNSRDDWLEALPSRCGEQKRSSEQSRVSERHFDPEFVVRTKTCSDEDGNINIVTCATGPHQQPAAVPPIFLERPALQMGCQSRPTAPSQNSYPAQAHADQYPVALGPAPETNQTSTNVADPVSSLLNLLNHRTSRSKLKTASQVHSELSLEAAIHEVQNGQSVLGAAQVYGVGRTTLRNRLQNPMPSPVGAPTKFAAFEEDRLAEFFLACSDMGVPLNRYHCLQIFSEVATELGLKNTAFNDAFFNRFISRHPEVSLRITHASNRKKDREWTTELCEEYISKVQSLFSRGFLDKPDQVWNLDETAFDTSEMYDRVVARKGVKQIPSQFDGNEKECVTILPCGNAAGVQLKFMALYAGKVHVQSRLDDTFGLCYHAVNSSGYMDTLHFANYIKKEVFPAMTELKSVIFLDGHYSHVNNLMLVRYCKQFYEESGKQVEIFCLPAGQTSHLQPFDVSAFGGVKKKWKMYLRDRKLVKGGRVTKDNLLAHVVKLWYRTEGCTERYAFNVGQSLQSGFAKTGLFPFSPEVIRQTVKLHHDPQIIERGLRHDIQQDFGPLMQILTERYNITAEKDLNDIREFVQLKQKGITPGAVLANVMQKDLFGEAPKKQRRQVNRQLNTEPGALITGPEFVAELEKEEEKKKMEKAAVDAKRKAAAEKKKNAAVEKDKVSRVTKRKVSDAKHSKEKPRTTVKKART